MHIKNTKILILARTSDKNRAPENHQYWHAQWRSESWFSTFTKRYEIQGKVTKTVVKDITDGKIVNISKDQWQKRNRDGFRKFVYCNKLSVAAVRAPIRLCCTHWQCENLNISKDQWQKSSVGKSSILTSQWPSESWFSSFTKRYEI